MTKNSLQNCTSTEHKYKLHRNYNKKLVNYIIDRTESGGTGQLCEVKESDCYPVRTARTVE